MKQLYELKDFSGGIISNADLADIPEGSAEDSLNINPMGKMGAIEPINEDSEIMVGVPNITSMVVRDGLDNTTHNLAVNIRENFIFIPNYASDVKLSDFVEIAEAGQLFATPTPILDHLNLVTTNTEYGEWNYYTDSTYVYHFSLIPTVPNYIYSLTSYCETVATSAYTVEADMPLMFVCKAMYDAAEEFILPANNTSHVTTDLTSDNVIGIHRYWPVKMAKELKFTAADTATVIVLRHALSDNTLFKNMVCQFSKGGYIWGPLGQNLDFTNTDKGLFIGSATSVPHVQGQSKDDKERILDFLEKSECTPPISATAMSNIDFMCVVPNLTETSPTNCDNLLCGIQSESHIWAVARDWDAGSVSNYTNFYKSQKLTFTDKGLGGMVVANDATNADSFIYCWDFEGWNIYKLKIPDGTGTHTGSDDWAPEYVASWNINLDDIPTDGFISKVETSAVEGNDKLYVLLSRVGGLKAGDNVCLELNIEDEGTLSVDDNTVKIVYKILPYQSVTAYTSHKRKKNWLGIPTDVNPTGSKTLYWSKTGQTPPAYSDGDYADISHNTTYGDIKNMCWANTDSDDVSIEIAENSLAVNGDGNGTVDVLTFAIKPMGATCFILNSGKWRKAEQWPNMWPDGDDPDGWWTNIVSNQTTTTSSMLVTVAPSMLANSDAVTTEYSAISGDIRERINSLELKLDAFMAISDFESVPNFSGETGTGSTEIKYCANQIRQLQNNSTLTTLYDAIKQYEGDGVILDLISDLYDELYAWHYSGWYYKQYGSQDTGYYYVQTDLYIYHKWLTLFNSSSDYYWPDNTTFKSQMNAFRGVWQWLSVLHGYDTDERVGAYNQAIIHREIGSNFPVEGGFDYMEAYKGPDGEERILCSKLSSGKISTTTLEYDFGPLPNNISVQMEALDISFSDQVALTPNENNLYVHEELEYITSVDPSGNVTRTATGEIAPITEFAQLIVGGDQVTAVDVSIPMTSFEDAYISGSNPMLISMSGSSPTAYPSLLTACFTGDVLLRSFQFNNTLFDPISSPFDSGELAVGITPEAGAVFSPVADQTVADAPFLVNDTVMYNMSFLFDGYQEGPLMGSPVTYTIGEADGLASINIRINVSTTNPRITAINIYSKKDPREKYRLVKQVEIDNEWLVQDAEGMPDANLASTAFMTAGIYTTIEDEGRAGISYEAFNGMPEVLKNTMVDYSESEELSGYLFVTNAKHDSVDNAEKYIFRSQPNKFSVFNWSKDYIGMPENVHSLKSCYNRLFAFSRKTMYQIDPHNLIVESKFDGMGITNQKSSINCDGVMYIANRNGVYIYGGGKFQHITQTIQDIWTDIFRLYPTAVPILASDKTYNSLLVMFDNAGTHSVDMTPSTAFSFSIDKRRWDVWNLPRKIKSVCNSENNTLLISAERSSIVGYDVNGYPLDADNKALYDAGESYETISDNTAYSIYELHTGATKKSISWRTKKITMGADSRDKKFKKIKFKGKGLYISEIEIDGTTYTYDSASTEFKTEGQYKYLDVKKVGKYVQVQLDTDESSTDTTSELESISITYNLRSVK